MRRAVNEVVHLPLGNQELGYLKSSVDTLTEFDLTVQGGKATEGFVRYRTSTPCAPA
jgi:hypothetical protein